MLSGEGTYAGREHWGTILLPRPVIPPETDIKFTDCRVTEICTQTPPHTKKRVRGKKINDKVGGGHAH